MLKKLTLLLFISCSMLTNIYGGQPACVCSTNAIQSSLYDAVRKNLHYRVFALLDAGADSRMADNEGMTPLHYAAMNNDAAIVSLLVSRGADVNAKNKEGLTPVLVACKEVKLAPFTFLIRNCDANCSMPEIEYWMEKFLALPMPHTAKQSLILAYDQFKNSAESLLKKRGSRRSFFQSARRTHDEICLNRLSLKIGIKVMLKQFIERNRSLLMQPLSLSEEIQMLEVIESWLSKIRGRTVKALMQELYNVVWTQTLKNLYAPQHHEQLITDLLEKLIQVFSKQYKDAQEINIDMLDDEKGYRSLLHQAVVMGDTDVVGRLMELGADVEVKDSYGCTPLAYAILTGNDKMFKVLINTFCADVTAVNYAENSMMDLLEKVMDDADEIDGELGRSVQERLNNIQVALIEAQKNKHERLQWAKQKENLFVAAQVYEELIADKIVEDLYKFVLIHQHYNVPIDSNIALSRLKAKRPLIEQVFKSNRRASALTLTELLMRIVWHENVAGHYVSCKYKTYSALLWSMLYKHAQEFIALRDRDQFNGAYAQEESKEEKRSDCGATVRSAYA